MSTSEPLTRLAKDVREAVRGHDLALYAAGVTFYAAIAAVPLLLLSVRLVALGLGEQSARDVATGLAGLLPDALGARGAARWLASAGAGLAPLAALAALLPATLYGEGLVRAFDRLSRHGASSRRSVRGRLGTLVVVAASPALLLAGVGAQSGLRGVVGGGLASRLLGVYVAFLVGWLAVSVVLLYCFRALAPERPGVRALLWGAFGTGSFVAGTSLGWVLFVSLGVPVGGVYGGSTGLAVAAVTALWLFVLHAMVLVGYVVTLCLAARDGHPLGRAVREVAVSARPLSDAA